MRPQGLEWHLRNSGSREPSTAESRGEKSCLPSGSRVFTPPSLQKVPGKADLSQVASDSRAVRSLRSAGQWLHGRRTSQPIPLCYPCSGHQAEPGVQSQSSVNLENLTKGTLIRACFSLFLSFPMTHNPFQPRACKSGLSLCSFPPSLPCGLLPTPTLIGL